MYAPNSNIYVTYTSIFCEKKVNLIMSDVNINMNLNECIQRVSL